jgi:hypothetical protein
MKPTWEANRPTVLPTRNADKVSLAFVLHRVVGQSACKMLHGHVEVRLPWE